MKRLKIILLMIIIISGLNLLNAEEIKIIENNDKDYKKVEFNSLTYFLVTPLFMDEVERIDRYNSSNENTIILIEEKMLQNEKLFEKSIKNYYKMQYAIVGLAISTGTGFIIIVGLVVGVVVFAVLNYTAGYKLYN